MNKRVAIIGAGPSGLSQLCAFKAAARKGVKIPEIVCFEKQSDCGGLWNYTWRTGVDEYGNLCHGSMYRHLWSNGPKEVLEFTDYSFEEHFGKAIGSYPPRPVLLDYLRGRAKKFAVREHIRFNTCVRDVRYDPDTAVFIITSRDGLKDIEKTEKFDHVIVASGHFSMPNVPYYAGFEKFSGRILHAHDFRDARQFVGQEILIIGTSHSAEDIGSQCWKYGCKSVTIAHRTAPIGYEWPQNWMEVPALERVAEGTAYFQNGQSKKIDSIILCTGYKHYFSFLPDSLRLKTENRLAITDLYKGVVFNPNPAMFYLGMQDQWYTFNMFDAQAWYVRDVILGHIPLPDRQAMKADVEHRQKSEDALDDDFACISYQGAYICELSEDTDCPTLNIDSTYRVFSEWKAHKKKGIMTYRDHAHRSPVTGKLASVHHSCWTDARDDSLENYMKDC